ncbi:hypothetical protein [Scopulibacillus cellulosilyticus]|uniref:Uncharacterized protein n=1 Tax=Scopulibacillus cellulosilyticus TaxID=2665665 RepID=A0ABW2Q085_9BACL
MLYFDNLITHSFYVNKADMGALNGDRCEETSIVYYQIEEFKQTFN